MKKQLMAISFICSCIIMLLYNTGCKKQQYTSLTTTDVNIVDYLKRYPDQFSELVKILDRTNISPFLNAYGTYTIFAPTNSAIKLYLQKIGKNSTDDLDTATLKSLCRLHLIHDTVSTTSFTDGKLYAPTMYGQFLTTSVNDASVTIVNRQAAITQSNILTGNGFIHVIDHVLQPAQLTIAQMIEQDSKYAIFAQALKATGLYDTLNIANNPDTTRRWLTFLAESDAVLSQDTAHPVNSYADLVKRFNNTGNPKDPNDSLYIYMAYHILPGIKYVADIVSAPSHRTLAPLAVITTSLDVQRVLLNEATFNGILEKGIAIDRTNSDNSATNGAVHSLSGDIYVKVRTPVPVFWDVADQPEIRKLASIFRKQGKSQQFAYGTLSGVTWQNSAITCQYWCEASTTSNYFYWDDHFDFNMRTTSNQNNWIEFTTPLLVKGTYKVWVCYRVSTQGQYVQVSVDGNILSRIVNMCNSSTSGGYLPSKTATDDVLESQGFKRYSAAANSINYQVGQLAGVVTITSTDYHKLRMTCIKDYGSSGFGVSLDMVHFIPVSMDQQFPRFARDGSIIKRP